MVKQDCNNQRSFTSISNNDSFSLLKGLDLKQLLIELQSFEPYYRYNLGFLQDMTFGVEMEYEGNSPDEIDNIFGKSSCYEWRVKDDDSSTKPLAFEVNSPVLRDLKTDYFGLRTVCKLLKKSKVYTSEGTAAQCHFGAQSIQNVDTLLNLLLIWCNYEDIIYRFGYGETKKPRNFIHMYAKSIFNLIKVNYDVLKGFDALEDLVCFLKNLIPYKEYCINFKNIDGIEESLKNTIEFRNANGILDEILWQALISLYGNLIITSSGKFDIEKLEKELAFRKQVDEKTVFNDYQKIDLARSLQFVDIIFKNNQDKVFFLNYYLNKKEISEMIDFPKLYYIGK
jgi:Putative amidoligase enzyme.